MAGTEGAILHRPTRAPASAFDRLLLAKRATSSWESASSSTRVFRRSIDRSHSFQAPAPLRTYPGSCPRRHQEPTPTTQPPCSYRVIAIRTSTTPSPLHHCQFIHRRKPTRSDSYSVLAVDPEARQSRQTLGPHDCTSKSIRLPCDVPSPPLPGSKNTHPRPPCPRRRPRRRLGGAVHLHTSASTLAAATS